MFREIRLTCEDKELLNSWAEAWKELGYDVENQEPQEVNGKTIFVVSCQKK